MNQNFNSLDTPSSLESYLVPYKSLYDHSYFANLKWNYSQLTQSIQGFCKSLHGNLFDYS